MNRPRCIGRVRSLLHVTLALFIAACIASHATGASAATWSTTDLKSNKPLPSGTTIVNSVTVKWQVGNYLSDGLQIYGLMCIPASLPGPHPVAILNHGLTNIWPYYPAIGPLGWTGCTTMAGNGWLTAISTYRGETIEDLPAPYSKFMKMSGGRVELCLGEVDDVLNLLSVVRAMPIANAKHVLMWGHSHGSCITERAVERGAPVQIAVTLDGPTDFTTWTLNPFPNIVAQHIRSSAWAPNNPLALTKVKFLRVQAEGDMTVTPDQACELMSKLPGSANYYLNSALTPPGVYYLPPKECAAFSMTWQKAQFLIPDEVPGGTWLSPTFLLYSGLDHSTIRAKAWPEFASFVNQFAKAGGWHALIPAAYTPFEN